MKIQRRFHSRKCSNVRSAQFRQWKRAEIEPRDDSQRAERTDQQFVPWQWRFPAARAVLV